MTRIVFADEKVKDAFDRLKDSPDEKRLYDNLMRAFKDIEENPSGFIRIRQKLIPKIYVQKHGIDNLWKTTSRTGGGSFIPSEGQRSRS